MMLERITKYGYARDLAQVILEGKHRVNEQDADSLFRTLVLDEGWSVEDAKKAYIEAYELVT